jgi:soluble lytic murein transglycosylase-like protein
MATVDQGLITRIAQQEGVDPALFNRLIMAESGGRSDAVSSAGAIGPAQLMPATAKELGVDPNDVEQNLTWWRTVFSAANGALW